MKRYFSIDKTDVLTESEPDSIQTHTASKTELELPEPFPFVSLFDSTAINISDENLKTWCNKKYDLYQKTYSIELYKNLLIVTEKQVPNPLWMLHRAGCIAVSKCYDVCHTDTEKISSPCSGTKSNKYTRYRNDNEPEARKYFAETQNAHHEHLIVNETGFKFHTEYPCIGASLDGIVTCSCHEIRRIRDQVSLQLSKRFS